LETEKKLIDYLVASQFEDFLRQHLDIARRMTGNILKYLFHHERMIANILNDIRSEKYRGDEESRQAAIAFRTE
jgi:hypothetical protein